jgi:catechol 2,3-dioxygenase-like lactoylglutathione lyase family enzyme
MLQQAIPTIRVDSAAAARAFFEPLGFAQIFEGSASDDPYKPDPCFMGFQRDEVIIHASSHSGDGAGGAVIYILVDDIDALHAEFTAKGVSIDTGPIDQDWGVREMYVKDSQNNALRFAQPLDAD